MLLFIVPPKNGINPYLYKQEFLLAPFHKGCRMNTENKTAYSVIKMTEGQGKHGVRPGYCEGVSVCYAADTPIKGDGYRLTATEVVTGQDLLYTRPHTDPQAIAAAIENLRAQQKRIGSRIREKILREREDMKKRGHPLITSVLYFQPSEKDGEKRLVARYGYGLNGRNGLVIFGNQGIVEGQNLSYVFFHSSGHFGWSIAVEDHDKIQKVIDDLSIQHQLALDHQASGQTPVSQDSGNDVRGLLRKAARREAE